MIVSATIGIGTLSLISYVTSMFGSSGIDVIKSNRLFDNSFSLLVIAIAALNLPLDFDFIEVGIERGTPKYIEWFRALPMMVTLMWLYLKMIRPIT